jgi:hypothetical protein
MNAREADFSRGGLVKWYISTATTQLMIELA